MKNRIKVKRAERNWCQHTDLARRVEVSRQTINAIETEKYDPSLPLAFKIAALFETSIETVSRRTNWAKTPSPIFYLDLGDCGIVH